MTEGTKTTQKTTTQPRSKSETIEVEKMKDEKATRLSSTQLQVLEHVVGSPTTDDNLKGKVQTEQETLKDIMNANGPNSEAADGNENEDDIILMKIVAARAEESSRAIARERQEEAPLPSTNRTSSGLANDLSELKLCPIDSQSKPGAFSAEPGVVLQRVSRSGRDTGLFSSTQQYLEQGISLGQDHRDRCTPRASSETYFSTDSDEEASPPEHQLSVANLVEEPSQEDLPVASEMQDKRRKRATAGACPWVALGGGLVVLAVGVLLVFFLVFKKDQPAQPKAESNELSPSMPLAKSESLESSLRALLPTYTVQELDNPGSPQAIAFDWLLQDPSLQDYTDARIVQRFALATLFHATSGPNSWVINKDWLRYDLHECYWYANEDEFVFQLDYRSVEKCHFDTGEIQKLLLNGNNLQGSIPEEFYLLTQLRYTSFKANRLVGSISSSIGTLTHLKEARWCVNSMTGTIPSQVGMLQHLRSFKMPFNTFTGPLPSELGNLSNLYLLKTAYNNLESTIPSELGRLAALSFLEMDENRLTGTLPSELGLMTSLQQLRLGTNFLSGSIPIQLGTMNLKNVSLSGNRLEGSIPEDIFLGLRSNDTALENFDVTGNAGIVGQIPLDNCVSADFRFLFDCSEWLCGCNCTCPIDSTP